MRKKLLAALLSVCIIVSMMVVPASASAFNDVSSDHWAASAIERWAGYEVLNGNGDGTFAPDRQMTRAEFASMLVNMLGLTKKSSTKFPDVPDNAWYAECISIAAAAGIITGDNGNAAPTRYISFNEAAVMLCRALGLAKTNVSGADWAKESIEKLTEMGAIGGSDTHLQAGADCNRAVVAALADKIVEQYVDEDTTITGQVKGVVLVVKGAKADIKDAVLSAPLVIESAEATLTNTTAQDVKVDGSNSAVTTDAKSAVAEVILGGEAPKADIKGTATSVTVAENATSAVVDAPASVEVKNESTSAITVNGETQEPTKTDDTTTTPEVTEGTSTPAHTHQWIYVKIEGDTGNASHKRYCAICQTVDNATVVPHSFAYRAIGNAQHEKYCTQCGFSVNENHVGVVEDGDYVTSCATCGFSANIIGGSTSSTHTHTWKVDTANSTDATCLTTGKTVYVCAADTPAQGGEAAAQDEEPSVGGDDNDGDDSQTPGQGGGGEEDRPCGATMTVTIPKKNHEFNTTSGTPTSWKDATCTEAGYKIFKCTTEGCIETTNVTVPALGHSFVCDSSATKTATQHTVKCNRCGETKLVDHSWSESYVCNDCGYKCKHPTKTYEAVEGEENKHNEVCAICGKVLSQEAEACTMSPVAGTGKAATCTVAGKNPDTKCTKCGKTVEGTVISALDHLYTNNQFVLGSSEGKVAHKKKCDRCGTVDADWTVCTAEGDATKCVCGQTPTAAQPTNPDQSQGGGGTTNQPGSGGNQPDENENGGQQSGSQVEP